MIDSFKTICSKTIVELTEKRSRFIALAAPVNTEKEAIAVISSIKKNHSDANHNCYAYRLIDTETQTEQQRCSDDGEPSGTAGMPILNVIKTNELFNCIIIVTRYFSGVMLGAGGLIRAYGGAAGLSIKQSQTNIIQKLVRFTVKVGYNIADSFSRYVTLREFKVDFMFHVEHVNFVFLVEPCRSAEFCEVVAQASYGKAVIEKEDGFIWGTN